MDKLTGKSCTSRNSALSFQILFFLRFVQLGSTFIAAFIACYFVWWHNTLRDEVPFGLIVLIFTSSLTVLESYISTAHTLSSRSSTPKYRLLLKSTLPSAISNTIGYYSLRQVPYIRKWCEGDDWFGSTVGYPYTSWTNGKIDPGVEKHHCSLACDIIVTGGIALSCTVLLAVFAAVGFYRERKVGGIKLEDGTHDYSDDLLGGHGDVEKVGDGSDGA